MRGIINDIIQVSYINIITSFVFVKLLNYKKRNYKDGSIIKMAVL